MLTVYEASAGSGKTFQLVLRYLDLLMKNPSSYRNILAVTFTNKATNEMKSRILEQLHCLSEGHSTQYLEALMQLGGYREDFIRQQAKYALRNVLHDYSRFSVSTIDSFIQRILKAFNREIGITPNFILELDNDRVLEEAVDRLLARIDTDPALKKWLVRFSEEKISENRSHRIEDDIRSLGEELFREKFQLFFPESESDDSPYTREAIEAFRKELDGIIGSFIQTLKTGGTEFLVLIEQNGFSVDDFSYRSAGIAGYLKNLSQGIIREPGKRVLAARESAEKWFLVNHKEASFLGALVEKSLLPKLKAILDYYNAYKCRYLSAVEVRKQLRTLGILSDLKQEVRELMVERGGIQLSDSNLLLSRIIENSDAPFIYEKTGTRYTHFLLDEFQDTSTLQWNNFKPLVENALAEGNSSLLVGDVKQSIYRWRNSDWNILGSRIYSDFPSDRLTKIPLIKNWRSLDQIITFNGHLFETLKSTFQQLISSDIEDDKMQERFGSVYQNLVQEPALLQARPEGMAEINFLPEEQFDELACELMVDQVKKLQDRGLKASDIAVLIRKNSEGEPIINAFLAASERRENAGYNLNVLSNESLFLKASRGVHFVILVLECLLDKDMVISRVALLHLWQSWLKPLLQEIENGTDNDAPVPGHRTSDRSVLWAMDPDLMKVYEDELGNRIEQLKPKLVLSSLDESVMEICAFFGLFSVRSEWPFLQSLIDQAAELKMTLSNDLSNFLLWWYERGIHISVRVNDEIDSVRLLTVHKAKGLEYEAVIVPFLNWNVTSWTGNQAPLLWCHPSLPPFDRFPLLPVKATKILTETIFRDDYFEEVLNSYIDTMNLIYVAFTRAKSTLYVNCKRAVEQKEGSDKPGSSVNGLLHHALEQMIYDPSFSGCWNEDKSRFRFGEMPAFNVDAPAEEPGWIDAYRFYDLSGRIALRTNSDDFLAGGEASRSVKNSGKLIHEILAGIISVNDLERVCQKAFMEGVISASEQQVIVTMLKRKLYDPDIKSWFDGSYVVLNERSLISNEGVFRPDRMMISGEQVVVVDYKWGFVKTDQYRKQVRRYIRLLQNCGYKRVKGYLWYINLDAVEPVD